MFSDVHARQIPQKKEIYIYCHYVKTEKEKIGGRTADHLLFFFNSNRWYKVLPLDNPEEPGWRE